MDDIKRHIIEKANERGYFPTEDDAAEIVGEGTTEYTRRSRGQGTNVDRVLFETCINWATDRVMASRAKQRVRRICSDVRALLLWLPRWAGLSRKKKG